MPHLLTYQKEDETKVRAKYAKRLHDELEIIKKWGCRLFSDRFGFIKHAKHNDVPVGPGRVPSQAAWWPMPSVLPTLIPFVTAFF